MTDAKSRSHFRNAAKALITREGKVLVTANVDSNGAWYILPGGAVHVGEETVIQALERECMEELGAHVAIRELICVREYIADNHEFFAEWTRGTHQIDFIFVCDIDDNFCAADAPPGDAPMQTGARWLTSTELESERFYPSGLKQFLRDYLDEGQRPPMYVGDLP